ncbi:MAG: hypothetical protein WBV82_27070 [Myxococcaceae bacterium]
MFSRFVPISLAVVLVSAAGCRRAVPDVDLSAAQPRVTVLQDERDPAEVRSAIVSALQDKGWVVEGSNGPEILARLNHKGATVRLSIVAESTRFVVTGLEATAAGKNYERWVRGLEGEINNRLKPAVVVPPPLPVAALTPSPTLVVFEREQRAEDVKGALQRALSTHSWVLEADQPEGLTARLNHKRALVRVRINSTTQQATITYLSSEGLSIDPDTGRSDDYEKWMRNLVDAIRAHTK